LSLFSWIKIRFSMFRVKRTSCILNNINKMFNSTTTTIEYKKAPSILILSGDKEEFKCFKSLLHQVLGSNSYTIYHIENHDLEKASLWSENCNLLITTSHYHQEAALSNRKQILEFMNELNGSILTIPSLSDHFEIKQFEDNQVYVTNKQFDFENFYQNEMKLKRNNILVDDILFSFNGRHFISKVKPFILFFCSIIKLILIEFQVKVQNW
jgi:hypothetical protein